MHGARRFALAMLAAGIAWAGPAAAQAFTTLHRFTGGNDGEDPLGALAYDRGVLYGATLLGGSICQTVSCGTFFAVNATTGAESVLHSFGAAGDGANPQSGPILAGGLLVGTTSGGGTHGLGTAYEVDPRTGAEQVLHAFQAGRREGAALPTAGLTAFNGALYGVTGGALDTVFRTDPTSGATTLLHRLNPDTEGSLVSVSLLAYGGALYGVASGGGKLGKGTLFKVDPNAGAVTVLYTFQGGSDGSEPSGLVQSGGALYGTTALGGGGTTAGCYPQGCGTVFTFDLQTGAETVLHRFDRRRLGRNPEAGVIFVGGYLYGTSEGAAKACRVLGCGIVFRLNPRTGAETVLYRFTGGSDGGVPAGALIYAGGALYGTTRFGGAFVCSDNGGAGCGTVFKLVP